MNRFLWSLATLGMSKESGTLFDQAETLGNAVFEEKAGERTLILDGQEGSCAHAPVPPEWTRLKAFRVDLSFRLDKLRGGSVPFSWPGAFQVYLNGKGVLWIMFETDQGRMTLNLGESIPLGEWVDVAFEYRASDFCLLYLNGKSVASLPGRGPLKRGGKELRFGRYDWTEDGASLSAWMTGAVRPPRVTILPDDDRFALNTEGLNNLLNVSWGDAIVLYKDWRKLARPEDAEPFVAECKRLGVTKVLLRCSSDFIMNYCKRTDMGKDNWYIKALNAVQGDARKAIIEKCHEAGIQVFAYHTIFDEGSPPTVLYGGKTPYPWQSTFTIEHPEYLRVSRDAATRHYGVLCYAYPEARAYTVDYVKHLMERWGFDGVYLCTRTHSEPARHGDQFGYNAPVAQEFKRRYGVDIRTESFDRAQLRDLWGEYVTQLFRDMRKALPGKQMYVGMPRADYLGAPIGNIRLDWRRWCDESLIDGLVVGVTSGSWLYPNITDLKGYVQSEQGNVAMPPLEYDLNEWFGPACRYYDIGVYLQRGSIASDKDRELLNAPGVKGFMLPF